MRPIRPAIRPSTSTTLTVDTIAPAVAITTIEGGDNIINAAEAAGGIQISGTAEIGSSLTVNGAAVTVDGTGHWTTSVTPAGQGALVVTAVATDPAGNSTSTSTTLTVDTIAPAVAITTIEGGDNIINAAEAAGGIQISGTAEIGSSLTVNGAAVTVDGTGHWTTSVTPAGQGALVVTAVATDPAGNSTSHLDDADGGHHCAGGGDHHHRGRRQYHQCGGSSRRHPDQRHRRDRLVADGERRGGDGGRHRALDHVGDAGGPGCAGGDGGCDRCGGQFDEHLDDADGRHHCARRWRSPPSRAATISSMRRKLPAASRSAAPPRSALR